MKKLYNTKGFVDLEHLFLKCKASYQACINVEGNEYLSDDIEVSINDLILQDDSVKFFIDSEEYGESIIDVRVNLFSRKLKKYLGYYRYIESLDGKPLDDYLVFD